MDYEAIKQAAQGYEAAMTKFLRDIVSKPAKAAVKRITSIALPLK